MTKKFDLIKKKLDNAKNIALICHIRPDGDALGSSLALYNYIIKLKKCTVFCDDSLPEKYNFLKNYDKIENNDIGNEFDLLICLDCSDLKRTGKYAGVVFKHNNTINIDHHISNDKYANINYIIDISSTCEIVYNMFEYLNININKDICSCIYCGLSSDTGNFSHSNTTYKTLEVASKLAKVIGDISFINQKIYKETPLCRINLLAEVLKNIKIYADGKIAILIITAENLEKYGCNHHDTEGIVDYAINICGVEIGAIFMESKKNSYKISLRSKNVNVCKVAAEFGGGGHIHASGCMLYGNLDEIINTLVKNAEFYL